MNRRSFLQGLLALPAVVGIKKINVPELELPGTVTKQEKPLTSEHEKLNHQDAVPTAMGSACVMYTTIWSDEEISKRIYSDPYVEGRSKDNAT